MSEHHYSVVFRGDIVIGENLADVKLKLKKIFKVDDSKIDALFSGRAVTLKTKLSEDESNKYQRVLGQAGIIVAIERAENESAVNDTKKESKPEAIKDDASLKQADISIQQKDNSDWGLAPVGSLLQDKKSQEHSEIDINLDHLMIMPQVGNLIADSERVAVPHSSIDVDVLDWELTPYGESLIKDAERVEVEPIDVDISALDVLENEGNLLEDSEKQSVVEENIDTSHISLMPDK